MIFPCSNDIPFYSHSFPLYSHDIPIDLWSVSFLQMIFPLKNMFLMPRKSWSGACRWRQRRRWDFFPGENMDFPARTEPWCGNMEPWWAMYRSIIIRWYSLIKNGESPHLYMSVYRRLTMNSWDLMMISWDKDSDQGDMFPMANESKVATTDHRFFVFHLCQPSYVEISYHTPWLYMTSPCFLAYLSWDPHVCSHRPMENILFFDGSIKKNIEQHIFMEIHRMLSVSHLHIVAIFSIANASRFFGRESCCFPTHLIMFQQVWRCVFFGPKNGFWSVFWSVWLRVHGRNPSSMGPSGTWVPCSPGGKGKKGGGKGKDCRAPQDDDCAEHEKSGDLHRAP